MIKDKVEQVKSNKEWRLEYMTLEQLMERFDLTKDEADSFINQK